MNVSNNGIGNVPNFNRNSSKSNISKNTNIYENKNAVRILINPRTLASKEYKEILKENNHYPIINPDVLLYDERLYLKRYSKS